MPRLGLRRDDAVPGQVEFQAVLVWLKHDPQPPQPFDDLDPERADGGVHAVRAELTRGPHDPMGVAVPGQRECVGHAEVGVLAEADDEHELVGSGVTVEVVAVVEVAV